ncbi:MAG: hypothetical protein K0S54_811, partial [Alphaproteobacteria bacterium]|nr:hypothetical protein [Alphaproteobacteria bacterium]
MKFRILGLSLAAALIATPALAQNQIVN